MTTEAKLELKHANWPDPDKAAWDALFNKGSVLFDQGPLAHWREATRRKCAQSYGFWLAYLQSQGVLDPDSAPADRATEHLLVGFVENTLERCTVETTHMRLSELGKVLRAMAPESDWTKLRELTRRLAVQCRHGDLKKRPGVSAREVYQTGFERMREAEADCASSARSKAVKYREGLTLALLAAHPLRLKTLLSLTVGRSVVKRHGVYWLDIAAADMKDGKDREFALPDDLSKAMELYLDHHRLVLLGAATADALWITKDGTPFSESGFSGQMAKLTKRLFGETMRTHAFRHVAATSIALEDPENVGIIANVLDHSSNGTAEKYYNRAGSVQAISAYQDVIGDIRKCAKSPKGKLNLKGETL